MQRRGKERDPSLPQKDPQPTDLDEKLTALRRRTAANSRPRDRPERDRMPPSSSATKLAPAHPPPSPRRHPAQDADHEDFSRRLKISSSPRPQQAHKSAVSSKLFNPDTDPIPMRRTAEPEAMSDATGSSYVHVSRPAAPPAADRASSARQLFDHRKDDPVRFSVLARPQQLSANGRAVPTPKSSGDYKLYRAITNLETKIKQEDSTDENEDGINPRVMLKGKQVATEDLEKDKWKKQIEDHKQLAEIIHNLLEISLAPSVPASLRNIPTKYNIIPTLNLFKSGWLEALGDLARYRMAVAAMVNGGVGGQGGLTTKAVTEAAESSATDTVDAETGIATPGSPKSVSDYPAARIDDSPSPSIGVAAARLLDVEPEKERWRNIARDWYGAGLAEQPGTGKLHHHLGLLSREVEGEELRAVYHFVKSMTTLHPFLTSRESILPVWSLNAQTRRSAPDAHASELFVLLHGMLFTNIQLDDFQPTLARFIERLEIEGAEEREWIMMAVINVSSVLEYGRPNGLLRRIGCVGPKEVNGPQVAAAMRVMAKKAAAVTMDVDEEPKADVPMRSPSAEAENDDANVEHPLALKFAVQLTFAMLSHVLRRPTRKASQYARSNINPYLTVLLTFLSTVLKHRPTLDALERSIPWDELAAFFARIPRKVLISQGLMSPPDKPYRSTERWVMLTSGCPPPLPEDWCLRGMEWVGRKVYERGFWKSGEDQKAELEVLQTFEGGELTDGTIEDDDGDDGPHKSSSSSSSSDFVRRWVRIARCAVNIAGTVDGFSWRENSREWTVQGKLADKLKQWKEEEQIEREEEERRRMGKRWVEDAMDVDEEEADGLSEEEDDENDSEEIKALKARRRYLKNLLQSAKLAASSSSPPRPRAARTSRKLGVSTAKLSIVPGYTILVVDTNILLSSLSMVSSLIESLRWTVVLDGLSSNASQLGEAAQNAVQYISSHVRSHALSLKIQTSKGCHWQDDHWVDRSSLLKADPAPASELQNAVKVVLLSLDRNRHSVEARSRQLPAASESDLAAILATAT
ncbi:hypothetical protein CPB84DRAFT_1812127 [Gymnopilus junonius]|uniref:PIN domain-containing protein n=1 Tax=Gymnopilus junonius TaxID=109634 RepID=A0A9P5P0S2_GYMJU|nr:hypothetical protein CPB84DRAFT_1812127 [Gymnopilus junonius]